MRSFVSTEGSVTDGLCSPSEPVGALLGPVIDQRAFLVRAHFTLRVDGLPPFRES
jgi:hypothetical protein